MKTARVERPIAKNQIGHRHRRDRRRLDRLNCSVAIVLEAMRNGCALHLEFCPTGPRWRTSAGRHVTNEVAKMVIIDKRAVAVGDALFPDEDGTSQTWTWRYVEECGA
jgi:hypothetical protein